MRKKDNTYESSSFIREGIGKGFFTSILTKRIQNEDGLSIQLHVLLFDQGWGKYEGVDSRINNENMLKSIFAAAFQATNGDE